jgi:hypothetical protein
MAFTDSYRKQVELLVDNIPFVTEERSCMPVRVNPGMIIPLKNFPNRTYD